jgi:hypothetical protein
MEASVSVQDACLKPPRSLAPCFGIAQTRAARDETRLGCGECWDRVVVLEEL